MIIYNDNENTLLDCLNYVDSFFVFNNGKQFIINQDNDKFFKLKLKLNKLFASALLMPALGVSLDNQTRNELKNGTWLQINFIQEQSKNNLPFNALLFKLEETQGFNLIRLYNNKYDGRCLYLSLDEKINLNSLK